MINRALFLAIRPKFVTRILQGVKTVELRRVRPNLSHGDLLLIYASSPKKELRAYSFVAKINQGRPKKLWGMYKKVTGLSRYEFDRYFYGADVGFAIQFGPVHEFGTPMSLEYLRKIWPGFKPPQIYRYLSLHECSFLFHYLPSMEKITFERKLLVS